MNTVPEWRLVGDWFDICSCDIPCPCEFAQAPTGNDCHGMLAWHVREGHFGDVRLDGFNLLALGDFEGNLWAGEAKATMGLFIDERATSSSARPCRRSSAVRPAAGQQALPPTSARCAASSSCRSAFEVADDLALLAGRDPGTRRRACGGPERADDATGQAGPDDQSAGLGGRPRRGCHLGPFCRGPHRGVWLRLDGRQPVEQAHPVRLDRSRPTRALLAAPGPPSTPSVRLAAARQEPGRRAAEPAGFACRADRGRMAADPL